MAKLLISVRTRQFLAVWLLALLLMTYSRAAAEEEAIAGYRFKTADNTKKQVMAYAVIKFDIYYLVQGIRVDEVMNNGFDRSVHPPGLIKAMEMLTQGKYVYSFDFNQAALEKAIEKHQDRFKMACFDLDSNRDDLISVEEVYDALKPYQRMWYKIRVLIKREIFALENETELKNGDGLVTAMRRVYKRQP